MRLHASAAKESMDPVMAFVVQERALALDVLKAVSLDLSELGKVLRGAALLSPGLLSLGHSLIHGETPAAWQRLWEGDIPGTRLRATPSVLDQHLRHYLYLHLHNISSPLNSFFKPQSCETLVILFPTYILTYVFPPRPR